MKEYIKAFTDPAAADGYEINNTPWIGAVKEPLTPLRCTAVAKRLSESGGTLSIVDNTITITGTWNPSATHNRKRVIISGEVVLNGKTDCYSLTFEQGGHLTINAGARLRVWEGGITNVDAESVSYLTFNSELSDPDDTRASVFGEFLLHPDVTVNNHPKAIVKTVTKTGYYMDGGKKVWRFHRFSLLVSELISWTKNPNVTAYIYKWDYNNDDWVSIKSFGEVTPFNGYMTTANQTPVSDFMFIIETKTLGNDDITITHPRDGFGYFGNSLTAKIDIECLISYFPSNFEKQLRLSPNEGDPIIYTTGKIASSQTFIIKNNSSVSTTITVPYKECVWNPSFEEEVEPVRSMSNGGSVEKGDKNDKSELPDSLIFRDPEPPFEEIKEEK